ncbi:MAG: hypothetical protein OER96_03805 [Gammaproteobacteria bacterium]|nr:hypothetical protein [Gammaproteobacteria bacterium]
MFRQTFFVFCMLYFSCPQAFADARLVYQQNVDTNGTFELIVKGSKVGIVDGGSGQLKLLFDESTSTFTFFDHAYRQYTQLSEQKMIEVNKRMQEEMKRIQANLDEQMKTMTPEQQAMVKQGKMGMQMMPGMRGFGVADTRPKNHIPSMLNIKVNDYQCRRVDTFQGGQVVQTQCVAEQKSVGLTQFDYDTILEFLRATAGLTQQGAFSIGFSAPPLPETGKNINGIPVQAKHEVAGQQVASTLIDISQAAVDAAIFEIPENYLQAKIPLPPM